MDKDKPILPVPHIEPPDAEVLEKLRNTSYKDFKKSNAYNNAVLPTIKRDSKRRRLMKLQWWKDNWIGLTTLLFAVLTLIATIVFGLLQVMH